MHMWPPLHTGASLHEHCPFVVSNPFGKLTEEEIGEYMTTLTTEHLLARLGWPEQHRNEKGVLTWNAIPDPAQEPALEQQSNTLTVTPKLIRARLFRISPDGPQPPHFEAQWDISPTSPPTLRSVIYAGSRVDQDQDWAVKTFNDLITLLQGRPSFHSMGIRWKPETSGPRF